LSRKLLLLDLVLVGVAIYAAVQLRNEWRAAKTREQVKLNQPLKIVPPPRFNPPPVEPPVTPSGYVAIAQNMLFDPSRNSTVVVEVPPPPPPKPVPPMPIFHGVMYLGGGLTAFFSTGADGQHHAVHIGENIGQFKLLGVNSDEITLEWEGETLHKKLAEVTAQVTAPPQQQAADVRTEAPAPATPPPPAVKGGPGELTNYGYKSCVLNDGNAEGTVIDGYKKVNHMSPFGTNCAWEPVGK